MIEIPTWNFKTKFSNSFLEWKIFNVSNEQGGFSGHSNVLYIVSVGCALLILEAISDRCWRFVGTDEHWEKNRDVLTFSEVIPVESTPCKTASIIFAGSLVVDLMHSGSSPTRSAVIKSQISFSVSKYVLRVQKLKFNCTPLGCSNGRSKGAMFESIACVDMTILKWDLMWSVIVEIRDCW